MNILLITPPMIQINTPYPATAYLKSYLEQVGHSTFQVDLSLELMLKVFSVSGLELVLESIKKNKKSATDSLDFFLEAFDDYKKTIEPVIRFLQGQDPSLAIRIANRKMLPEGPRFLPLQKHGETLLQSFGSMGTHDKAKFIASLYLDDLSDVLKDGLDPDFQFSRYAESLASSQISFSKLYEKLNQEPNLLDRMTDENLLKVINQSPPELVVITFPFPGNLYAGLRIGQSLKRNFPQVKIAAGGGFVNTELRGLSEPKFFEFIDFLTYDDGERPLEVLVEYLQGKRNKAELLRTKYVESSKVVESSFKDLTPAKFKDLSGPTFADLKLDQYISMLELPNPMHRMWSDYRWNKMMLAHGCYWKKCSFCDTNLPYISHFEPGSAKEIVDQMERIIKETKSTGFHFVDEAAPPALLRTLSKEILKRGLHVTWWGNLRFDKQFDEELCELMADAGCVAVTGGLEVASPRLLTLINKGVSLEQVARVTHSFQRAGIFVHAYLMYGFPTETIQETVDSLEIVRQLFQEKCLNSAHWHRFLATIHSDVGRNPHKYQVELQHRNAKDNEKFAEYEIPFVELNKAACHESLGVGLRKALYNYMHDIGIKEDVCFWFEKDLGFKIPKTKINPNFIKKALKKQSL